MLPNPHLLIRQIFPRCFLFLAAALPLASAPADFGMGEFRRALAARGLLESPASIRTQLVAGKPECYRVTGGLVTGSDERGLMYGLLEAAAQIRAAGRLSEAVGCPATAMRGIRYFIHNRDLDRRWYYSREYWDEYFAMLARNRFNRFNLVFAHQTNYLAPPYPFWLDLPEFPEVRVPGLSAGERRANLEMLQYIVRAAAAHGIDFTLGIWEHDAQDKSKSMVEGLNRQNIGPYSHAALKKILELCPEIRSVQMRTNEESGIPASQRLEFYRDYVFTAIRDAGRPVYLDLRAWAVAFDMIEAAQQVGVPLRVSTKYWAEDVSRPYQPAETYRGYSYLDFLHKPHSYQFYWELWGLGSHRLLLWGNPGFVRRAVPTFRLGDGVGFEIDPPLAQKGFGNRPGEWGVFTAANRDRMFWKWEFERYWLFYMVWGRLSYDSATPDSVWLGELRRRFGAAAPDVFEAYRNASGVVGEIVAVHMSDPNMYVWPEINPGGLLGLYRDALPSDWRYVASIPEAVENRIRHIASARQTPRDTARILNGLAQRTEEAVARADAKIPPANPEWRSSKPDFQVLALLARYHALKQTTTDQVAYFDATGDPSALESATRDLQSGLEVWERLVRLTDGLYPAEMAFGPSDTGHWKDKLPYVRHDLEAVRERADLFARLGRFDAGFDFGGPVKSPANPADYRYVAYILRNTVAPGFRPVDAETRYTDERGYGWASEGPRVSVAIPLTPYLEVLAVAGNPGHLPHDVLYRDSIRGSGAQVFRARVEAGPYTVRLLHPDRSETKLGLTSDGPTLDIVFPAGKWEVSGVVLQGPGAQRPLEMQKFPERPARPAVAHEAPGTVTAGRAVELKVRITPAAGAATVRLHYRPVNQQARFKTLENKAGDASFTIPAEEVPASWDLMYYFEILNAGGTGWFQPDPYVATPYYVVKVQPAAR